MKTILFFLFALTAICAQTVEIDQSLINQNQSDLYELRDSLSLITDTLLEADQNFDFYLSKEGNLAIEVAIRLNTHLQDLLKIRDTEGIGCNNAQLNKMLNDSIESYFKPQYEWVLQGMDYIILNSESESLRGLFSRSKSNVKTVYELF